MKSKLMSLTAAALFLFGAGAATTGSARPNCNCWEAYNRCITSVPNPASCESALFACETRCGP